MDTLLEPELLRLTEQLRAESNFLKECFTKYAFQSVTIAVAILGLLVQFMWDHPETGLASLASATIVLACARLGTFKYAAACRNFGYELHLYRTRKVPDDLRGRWDPEMRWVGWEEAMRAWRTVQTTLFRKIHLHYRFWPNFYRKKFKGVGPWWFRQASMFSSEKAGYHAGSYLRTMLLLLHSVAAASVVCMIVVAYRVYQLHEGGLLIVSVLSTAALLLIVMLRIFMDESRRRIIEDGILSIHSCAMVWQAVVVAHCDAMKLARAYNPPFDIQTGADKIPDGAGCRGYTYWLSIQAESLADHADDLAGWIAGRYNDELEQLVNKRRANLTPLRA